MQYLFSQMYNNKKKRKENKSLNRKDLIPLYKIELESSCNSFQVHRMYMYIAIEIESFRIVELHI